jgi:hypothetical protein
MFQFLRTRQWIIARRVILVAIVLLVALNRYGDGLTSLLYRPNPKRDIEITRTEFRADIPAARPVWIIGFKNTSRRFTYDSVQLEANYFDKDGTFLQKDKLVVHQRLDPLEEKSIASPDFKERPNATRGTLTVLDAVRVK